jgi:hypothetical protein
MEARIERFRRAVAESFGGRPGRGARYREDLRHEAVILARAGILGGQSLGSMAGELGVGSATLGRWLERAGEALRPVEVQAEGRSSHIRSLFTLSGHRDKLPSRLTSLFRRKWQGKDVAIAVLGLLFVSMTAYALRKPIGQAQGGGSGRGDDVGVRCGGGSTESSVFRRAL